MKVAIFPGSFDPFTTGHEFIVNKSLSLFDKVIIAVGSNTTKKYYFTKEERLEMIRSVFKSNNKVIVEAFEGLTVNFCAKHEARFILRGLRNGKDFEYEKSIALMNSAMNQDINTVFLLTHPSLAAISSTILREILSNKGGISPFIPSNMKLPLK